jgi:glycosyltransferase involved in cell wall biosynthesis
MAINFGIITPTFNRRVLLRRYLRRVGLQTYRQWRLLVVHDGPNPSVRSLVEGFGRSDSRVAYLETEVSAANSGVTPRLEGVSQLVAADPAPDYVVFWDDDNDYAVDALERIAVAVEAADRPDLLLVGVKYGSEIIPPADVPLQALTVGQVDTASLIFRPSLARDAFASVQRHMELAPEEVLHFCDFLAYQYVNQLVPPRSVKRDVSVLVCRHDGLRWGPFIRQALGIPRLGLARLIGLGR